MIGLNLTPGEQREVRECRVSPLERVTIDGPTGKVLVRTSTVDEGIAYYEAHPEELPANKARAAIEQALQARFVEAAGRVPAALTAPCDASWSTTTLQTAEVALCHPRDWAVKRDNALEVIIGTGTAQVGVLAASTESHNTKCVSPVRLQVSSGEARVCVLRPTPHARVGYGVALPNGKNLAITIFNEATPGEEALALRVAANVVSLP